MKALVAYVESSDRRLAKIMSNKVSRFGQPPSIPKVCSGPGEPGLVSVLITTFNRGYIVGKAVASVLAQSYRPIEVIVVDDGSTDDTRDVIARFGQDVKYVYQTNQGLAAARNAGLAAARGEFIAFQDSDDLWLPWKLTAQVELLKRRPELALVWTDMTAVDDKETVIKDKYLRSMYHGYGTIDLETCLPRAGYIVDLVPEYSAVLKDVEYRCGDIFGLMFYSNIVHPPTVLLRREHIRNVGGLDFSFASSCEDYEFLWRVSQFGPAGLIEASSILYRVNAPDQLTSPNKMLNKARANVFLHERKLRNDRKALRLTCTQIREQMAHAYSWLAFEELFSQKGSRWNSLRYFVKSLVLNPMQKRTLAFFFLGMLLPGPLFNLVRALKQGLSETVEVSLL